ncbi:MAG: Do family serine endopeptidase [Rhodospirillaceae bacterium]
MPRARTVFVSALAIAAVGGGLYLARDQGLNVPVPVPGLAPAPSAPASVPQAGSPGTPMPFATVPDVVERVTPAVVNIQVRAESTGDPTANLPPIFQDPRFRRFFGIPDQIPRQQRSSVGSGVVVDAKQGYVLTNFHVVNEAVDIAVTLRDRRTFTAKVVGKDQATDLALLKIDAPDLTALPLGNMAELRVGDYVLAVGNPFALGQTVTSGIISALGRAGFIEQGYEDFIQTDAAINPGNSGGALVNLKGELIGIPTVIASPSGGNVGIGFAVPVSIAANVMEQLIQNGEVTRGRIGVAIVDVTPELAQNLGLDISRGALVRDVQPGTAAAEAGIKSGDVVVAMNGLDVDTSSSLRNRVGLTKPGETVKLSILRDGEKREIDVTVGKVDPNQQAAAAPVPAEPSRVMGAIFENSPEGVIVRDVEENSPAAAIGLLSGDVITAVNRTAVKTVAQLEEALKAAKSQSVVFVRREERQMVLVVP